MAGARALTGDVLCVWSTGTGDVLCVWSTGTGDVLCVVPCL